MKFKKIFAVLLAVTMMTATMAVPAGALGYGQEWTGASAVHTTQFTDVPATHWAYENVMRAVEKGWFSGYPDHTFHPNDGITRAEALAVFVKFLGIELKEVTTPTFYDVDVNKWYTPYIEAGKDLLPVNANFDGNTPFRPDMPVTREDTMYALVIGLKYASEVKFVDESVLNMFKDQNSISTNMRPYIAWAVKKELVAGNADGTIGAQDPLTRAQFATLLYRASMFGVGPGNPEAKLQSVSVTPSSRVELHVGEEFTIAATATYSDGSQKPYASAAPYNADDNGVVSINDSRVTAKKEGNCEIKFRDENLASQSIIVVVARGSGSLSLNLSDMETATSASYIIVSGTAKDTSGAKVSLTCNDNAAVVDENGVFSVVVPLEMGENVIEVTAVSESGSSSSKSFTVSRIAGS